MIDPVLEVRAEEEGGGEAVCGVAEAPHEEGVEVGGCEGPPVVVGTPDDRTRIPSATLEDVFEDPAEHGKVELHWLAVEGRR